MRTILRAGEGAHTDSSISENQVCASYQNCSLSANWICREFVEVAVMTAPEGLYSGPWRRTSSGYEKLGGFKTLHISARNCKFNPSLNLTLSNKEMSTLTRPEPRHEPRATFP